VVEELAAERTEGWTMATNDHPMKRLIAEQRRRCVATILGSAETSGWWDRLSKDDQLDLRDDVLKGINTFYELVLDVIKVSDDGTSVVNSYAVDLLQAIHTAVVVSGASGAGSS
jgi:hypothetical protein